VRRVTADSNVLVSALRFGGKPLTLLNLAQDGQIELALSDDILAETLDVLTRPKIGWTPAQVEEAGTFLRAITTHVSPTETLDVVKADPSDDRILECAVAVGSNVIISGDKHLLALGSFRRIEIMNVSDFLAQGRGR
jgi:putative PIN family toxin of toxin-antitoxin system